MRKRLLFNCLLFLLACTHTQAQTIVRCATDLFIQNQIKNNTPLYHQMNQLNGRIAAASLSNARTTSETYPVINIPVVVHIIHNNADGSIGGANISDAQVLSQMTVLNTDYRRLNADTINAPASVNAVGADVQFNFCLANSDPNGNATTGITRTYSSQASFIYPTDETTVKSLVYWPSDQYLNIWVCNLFLYNTTQTLLGITQLPGGDTLSGLNATDGNALTDGTMINYQSFGTTGNLLSHYALGRTATHEIGHWFGLFHPWGNYNSDDCSLTDYCADTPVCGDPFYAVAPACTDNPSISCGDRRMIEAFLEYSDDGCMNTFTQDQKTRMRLAQILSPRRLALLSSHGCCAYPGLTTIPYTKDFEDSNILSGGWTDINPNSGSSYTKGFVLSNESAYGIGSHCISVTNDSIYISTDSLTYKYQYSYISPYFNIADADTTFLQFDWAYSPQVASGNTDSIVVYYSSGCGNLSWRNLYTLYGSGFSSTNNARSNFSPTSKEWKTLILGINPNQTGPVVQFKFVAFSKGVNTFYLDNINIKESLPSSDNLQLKIFPNPTSEVVNIEALFNGPKNLTYTIYNVLGQLVYQSQVLNANSDIKQINVSTYASGLYFVQVSDGSQKAVQRLIKL